MFFAAVRNRLARVLLAALLIAAVGMPPWAPLLRPAHAAGVPELPRVYLDTTYALPTGPTITVPAGGDFQAALNSAQPGSVIVLQAGATYAGNFSLPNKTGAGWIYIQSSALTSLPAPGTRVTPAQAALMPKLIDTSGLHNGSAPGYPTIQTQPNAHHYRLVGLEITTNWTTGSLNATDYALVNLDCPWTCSALSQVPTNIVIDRSYIHGTPTGNIRNGLILNSASTAIVDSWISDIHEISNQSHAIIAFDGPGPFKIVNNELQAAGLSIYFSDQARLTVPADIEVRGNHLFKPLSWWHPGDPNAGLTTWSVKNSFELKNAARVLVDGNVFENAWNDYFQTNSGAGITLTPRAGNCGCSWHLVQDVTITHNIITNTTMGTSNLGTDNNGTTLPLQRALLRDNLFLNIGAFPDVAWGNQGRFLYSSTPSGTGFIDVTFDHNTVVNSSFYNMYIFGGGSANFQGLVFTNNITTSGGGLNGNTLNTLNASYPGYLFTKNAMVGGTDNPYPTGNFFPSSYNPGVGFANYAGADYHLAASSPYKNAGTDGRDLGADIDAVLAATATAITGIGIAPPPTPLPTLSVTPQTAVDFGAVAVGGSADRSFTVTNTGSGSLTGTASGAAPFSVISGGSFSLGAGASQTVVARFSPIAAGSFANTASFSSNAGTASRSVTGTATADITPPAISSVTVSSIALTTAAIAWTTNEPADSQVEYGPTTAYGSSTLLNATLVTAHAVPLSGLVAGTPYHYRVKSRDGAGNLAVSADLTFTTTAVPDTTAPSVAVTAPTAGTTVSGTTNFSATASDNVGVVGVQFMLDGVTLMAEVSAVPYAVSWNTTTATNGSHTLTAVARDGAGSRTTSAAVSVTVSNAAPDTTPPGISSVAAGSITSSGGTIIWTTDEAADSVVEYGPTVNYGSATPLDPNRVTMHTVTLNGLAAGVLHHYRVKSTDAAGNRAQSADFTFTTLAIAPVTTDPPPTPQDPGTPPPPTAASTQGGSGSASGGGGFSGGSGFESGGGSPTPSQSSANAPVGTAPAQGAGVASGSAVAPGPDPANTWSAAVPAQTQSVVWSSLVNVTSTGSSLRKISGCDGCPDAGAVSQQQIASGNGYLEFTASETNSWRLIGFRSGNRGANQNEIRFAISLRPGGMAEVRELGMRRTNTNYVRGDVFRIAVLAGTVRYYKNGRLLYISGLAPAYPFTVGTSLMSRGATVTRAIISGRLSPRTARSADTTPLAASTDVPTEGVLVLGTVTFEILAGIHPARSGEFLYSDGFEGVERG